MFQFYYSYLLVYTYALGTHKTEGVVICFSIQVDRNINKLSDIFGAQLSAKESSNVQKLLSSPKVKGIPLKTVGDDGRVFSNYFANIIIDKDDRRLIEPMRYRVRPRNSIEEIPSKFNVFNARIDSLEVRKTWKPLFMKNHGIIPMTKFYEWVSGPDGKAKLISFYPEGRDIMWAPILYDEWKSTDESIMFKSFAIITDGPPKEIEEMGHDRCPIFLDQDQISEWLNPKESNKKRIYDLLKKTEEVKYSYSWVD